MEAGVPVASTLWYFLFRIPFIIALGLPIGLLLAILITFGIMSKRNELIALKSSGISIFHLFKPVATLGILSTLLLFFLSESVVPATMAQANRIWLRDVEKVSALATQEKNIWIKGDHAVFNITQYDPVNQVMYGFSAYYIDDHFQLIKRLDAEQGHFINNQWVFQNLLAQELDPVTDQPDVSFHDLETLTIELLPDDLEQVAKTSDAMSFRALRALIQKVEARRIRCHPVPGGSEPQDRLPGGVPDYVLCRHGNRRKGQTQRRSAGYHCIWDGHCVSILYCFKSLREPGLWRNPAPCPRGLGGKYSFFVRGRCASYQCGMRKG